MQFKLAPAKTLGIVFVLFYRVTNSSDGLIFEKKDGPFFSKNTGVGRTERRAKNFFFCDFVCLVI